MRTARWMAGLATALFLVALLPTTDAAATRTLTITQATAQPQTPFQAFDGNPAKAFDLNGDGRLEILAQNDNQRLYVFSSANGARLAELSTTFPFAWEARSFNGPESYRDGSGVAHIVVANSAAYLTSFRYDAATSTAASFRFVKEWERRTTDCTANPGMDAKPVLADLDRDGDLEILAATEENGLVALRADGSLLWKKCVGGGNAEPAVGDLNLDGWPDLVHASDAGLVTAMNGRTGATMWSFNVPARFNLGSGSLPVGAAIGQLDGLGGPDVVVGARDAHDADTFSNNHALLLALDSAGRLLWGRQDPAGNPLTYTHPIIADADADGRNEVYWGDWNTMGHKPPFDESQAWQVTGPANYYRYDHQGNRVWKQTLDAFWSNKDLALADVDGDGKQELLANGPQNGHDGVWVLDSATGAQESFIDVYPYLVTRMPVLYDLAGDGRMDLVIEAGPMATSAGPAVLVYDAGVPFNALWPHLPENQPGTAPPAPESFAATFTVKSPNPWWQEVSVQPASPRALAKVEVRFPGFDWQPMAKASWGAWTSSYSTPAGTRVEFLATATDGAVSQSLPFTWMDGTLSKGSTTPGPPPTTTTTPPSPSFAATFTVPPGVNEWWVEVAVDANQMLAGVDAKAGTAAWTPLTRTDWGTWAKSFNVPAGTPVQFRATSTSGAAVTSQTYTWLSSGSPPPPGGFTAAFQPVAVGNDWWVEAKVTANEPVSLVEARLNSGPWTALALQSWGTWAKSLHTPDGTQVTFRATSSDGDVATSAPVTWT